jgi:hypothetical protein
MNNQGSQFENGTPHVGKTEKPCPHCGGSDIVIGLSFGRIEGSVLGLRYKAVAFFTGSEELHADLCRTCGTVLRIFVNNPKQNWVVK